MNVRMLTVALCAIASLATFSTARTASAACSIVPPFGFGQIAYLGATSSPFLVEDLTVDLTVIGVVCDHESRSAAADFKLGGAPLDASDLVVTIAFTPQDGAGLAPVLVLADDPTLCGGDAACTVDTTTQREIVELPLPGGGFERRLRVKYPGGPNAGPAQLAVRLTSAAAPVAFELRDTACSDIAGGSDVLCLGRFFVQDGSCRKGDEFVNQPFSGLVVIPRTDFVDICTEGCEDVVPAPVQQSLPVTTDRDGNLLFGLIFDRVVERSDRGDGVIVPNPRVLRLGIGNAVASGFADDQIDSKPSAFTERGAGLSPPFNPANDLTAPADEVRFWGAADAESSVVLVPRQSCSDDPARACGADSDCSSGAVCRAVEFDFAQTGQPVQLPVSIAQAAQAVELDSWLRGDRTDAARALTENELLGGDALNKDLVADDFVVELLDGTTGLLKKLGGLFVGRGVTRVRVVDGDKDFVVSSLAAEDDKLVYLESEQAEGLADPLGSATPGEVNAADLNANLRLDQNLRIAQLPADKAAAEAVSLLPDDLHVSVLPELRFDGAQNVALSEGKVFFAYKETATQAHAFQLANVASDGTPGNFFAGDADLSSNGDVIAFSSGADNLFVPGADGALATETAKGVTLQALTPMGAFPEVVDGKSIFAWEASTDENGVRPSHFYIGLEHCDPAAGDVDLLGLLNLEESGPNFDLVADAGSCSDCNIPDTDLGEFDRGLGKGKPQIYTLVFDSPFIPAGEIAFAFKAKKGADTGLIRGPACRDPRLQGGIDRIYVRNLETGTTDIVSANSRTSCDEDAVGSNDPSGNPDVNATGGLVFFDSLAQLGDDTDASSDVYVYDETDCSVTNLTGALAGEAGNPSGSDDGNIVAFETGAPSEIVVLDRSTGDLLTFGPGHDVDVAADGTKLVFADDVAGVSQVFLVDLGAGSTTPVPVSVLDGEFGDLLVAGGGSPSVANDARTAFDSPPGDPNSEILLRDVEQNDTSAASTVGLGQNLCTSAPCGAMSPSISDDGNSVAFVVRGLLAVDEVVVKNLVTGSVSPLSRLGNGIDGDSLDPNLGFDDQVVALSSLASSLGGVSGDAAPNVFVEGPVDASVERQPLLGLVDLSQCDENTPCAPVLTGEPVTKGAVFEGDVAVVGSPVRVVNVGGGQNGFQVESFGREGLDVALSGAWVCAVATHSGIGSSGPYWACGARGSASLFDVTFGGAPIAVESVGLCGSRAIAIGVDGILYEADLASGPAATAVDFAEDFSLGDDQGNSCLVAYRSLESELGGPANSVGNQDVDKDDLAMALLGLDSVVTDCQSSATDCPGAECEFFDYQAGLSAVLFLVDENDENFGGAACTDVNEDGLCDLAVRRCTAEGSLTDGTSYGGGVNLFSQSFQQDGENTVIDAGFCGTDPQNVRIGQLCTSDDDCLLQPGETCQFGVVAVSAKPEGDGDEIPDIDDNCPGEFNPGQEDADGDGLGDECDTFNCGDGEVQEAEGCDEGKELNGMPGSSCSADCTCQVNFEVTETLKPGSSGNTPITIFGSAASDGSGCLNLSSSTVAGIPPRSIDATTLRLSATPPAQRCPTAGGAPIHNLAKRYKSHLGDQNGDGIKDLKVHVDTSPIGGDSSTTMVYLTGEFTQAGGIFGDTCFEAVAPVDVAGN